MNIWTSRNIRAPTDNSFLHRKKYIKRAGIIPYYIDNNNIYILLGISNDNLAVYSDLGGRIEHDETTLECAIREFTEESRGVIPINLANITDVVITGPGNIPSQAIFYMKVTPNKYLLNISDIFKNTIPRTKYENEMKDLVWISYSDFPNIPSDSLSNSLIELLYTLQHL